MDNQTKNLSFHFDDLGKVLNDINFQSNPISNKNHSSLQESDIEMLNSPSSLNLESNTTQKYQANNQYTYPQFKNNKNDYMRLQSKSFSSETFKLDDSYDFVAEMQKFHLGSNTSKMEFLNSFNDTSGDEILRSIRDVRLSRVNSNMDVKGYEELIGAGHFDDFNHPASVNNEKLLDQLNLKADKQNFKKVKTTTISSDAHMQSNYHINQPDFIEERTEVGSIDIEAIERLFKELNINILDKRILTSLNKQMIRDMANLMLTIKNTPLPTIVNNVNTEDRNRAIRTNMRFKKVKAINRNYNIRRKTRKMKNNPFPFMSDTSLKLFKFNSDSEESCDSNELSFERQVSGQIASDSKDYELIYNILHLLFEKQVFDPNVFLDLNKEVWLNLIELIKRKFIVNEQYIIAGLKKNKRRNEEQCKFVFKKAMKKLFKLYKAKNNYFIKGNKILDEVELYNYYFKSTADKLNEPIELFYLPGSKLQIQTSKYKEMDKTISYIYMKRVFSSEDFKQDFIKYLLESFVDEYKVIRAEKLERIREKILGGNFKVKSVKLPWTNEEILEAQTTLFNIISGRDNDLN